MCGLIAAFHTGARSTNPVNQFIIDQFEDQVTRGIKGFGTVFIDSPQTPPTVLRATEPTKFLLDLYTKKSPMILAHHRTPTSSGNYLNQTHPMLVDDPTIPNRYLVMHNGSVLNDKELKAAHEALGISYRTPYTEISSYYGKSERLVFNDSEALAIEFARLLSGQVDILDIRGSFAVLIAEISKETDLITRIVFGRHANPLNMAKTNGSLLLSSEGPGNELKEDTLYAFAIDDPKMKLVSMAMKIAVPPAAPKVDYSYGGSHYNKGKFRDEYCYESGCREDRLGSTIYCTKHQKAVTTLPVPKGSTIEIKGRPDALKDEQLFPKSSAKEATIYDFDSADAEARYGELSDLYEEAIDELENFFDLATYPDGIDENEIEATLVNIRRALKEALTKVAQNHQELLGTS